MALLYYVLLFGKRPSSYIYFVNFYAFHFVTSVFPSLTSVTCIWFNFYRFIVLFTFIVIVLYKIDQFRYIKIQPNTIDLNTRLWGITTEFVGFIPQSLVLRSIVLG